MHDGAGTDQVTGLVERVTYHSEETGFAVLRVLVRGRREPVIVVGTLPAVTAGEWLDARGRFVIDRQHGLQLRADSLRTAEPDTPEGIERYLGSGAIRGVGAELARRLVKAFGRAVFSVIEKEPARLREIDGIGPIRAQRIAEGWQQQRAVRQIMLFLHSHGVSTSRAFRIWKAYGDEAIERVQADPYCLARDIRGIGFLTADRIAERLGVERTSELRARAGLEHVLAELTEQGHCAWPEGALLERSAALLEIPEAVVGAALAHGIGSGRLIRRHRREGDDLVLLAALDRAEAGLARDLAALASGPHPCPPVALDRALPWIEAAMGVTLAAEQRRALETTTSRKVVVITGGPGVGKTTLVQAVVRVLEAKRLRVVLAAPTGRAAKRLAEATAREAKTIHRLLAFDPRRGEFRHDAANPLEGDVFIIDETSMVDLPLAFHLVRAIPRRGALVLLGDVDQLPSVGPGLVLGDVIESGAFPVCRLREVFRQAASSLIVTNAHRINDGRMPRAQAERAESDFYTIEAEAPQRAVELIVRLVREAIPRRFALEVQVLTPMQRGELGARNLNAVLQAALNPTGPSIERFGWCYRRGDRVIQLENDYDKDVFNGDLGQIEAVDEASGELAVRFDDRLVGYSRDELDELGPAYAVTVHKAQGSEYPAVVVPIHTQHYPLLQRNLLYTAVTRGKRLVVLVGTRRALAIAVRSASATARVTTLAERLRHAAASSSLPRAAEPEGGYEA